MERETGIEPATNSLEGCDSTTELLPPTRPLRSSLRRGKPAAIPSEPCSRHSIRQPSPSAFVGLPTEARLRAKRYGGRRLVAREGFEPSKPLGRQIYSLLRLTASLPRRYPPADAPGLTLIVLWFLLSGFAPFAIRAAPASHRLCPGLVSVTRCQDGKHGAGEGI